MPPQPRYKPVKADLSPPTEITAQADLQPSKPISIKTAHKGHKRYNGVKTRAGDTKPPPLRRPYTSLTYPPGHCWHFLEGSCIWGARCHYKHDEGARIAFIKARPSIAEAKQPSNSTKVVSQARPKMNPPKSTAALTPKFRRPRGKPSPIQYPSPPATPNDAKDTPKYKPKKSNLTPPLTPEPNTAHLAWVWSNNTAEGTVWDTRYPPVKFDVWAASESHVPAEDITTRVFSKIHSAAAKLPRLTTQTRRSHDNVQSIVEVAEAALNFVLKRTLTYGSAVFEPEVDGDWSLLVRAGEAYKKALGAGKMPNVLKKSEQAHLDIIIASQHWDDPTNDTKSMLKTSILQISKSVANPPEHLKAVQKTSTKTWEKSDYWAWAQRNLTSETAIKLVKTYRSSLDNGTAPLSLYSNMGKQAPPGTTFHHFSLLPYELREQIWLEALAVEKNDVRLIMTRETRVNGRHGHASFVNANKQQRLLFVNRELHHLAMHHNYELAFGTRYSPAKTYFDFSRDRLFLHTKHSNELHDMVRHIQPQDADRISVLAVPLRDFVIGDEHRVAEALCKFRKVKHIHLVCGDGLEDKTYAGAGDPKLAKSIEKFIYKTWRQHNSATSWPKVRMYTIPALSARLFGIDEMMY